jgi:hypothetical protein
MGSAFNRPGRDAKEKRASLHVAMRLRLIRVLLVVVLGLCAAGYLYVEDIHDFLSPKAPIDAQILVIEGWLPDDALEKAAALFASKHYGWVITSGVPLDKGSFLSEYKTYANVARATLIKISNRKDIVAVAGPSVRKDRSYASALAVKRWLNINQVESNKVNVVTLDAHARRSWYLFKKALGDQYSVGIIAINSSAYDGKRWWRSSEGFKTVVDETIAYVYTLVVFPFADDLGGEG